MQISNGILIYSVVLLSSRLVDYFKQGGNELTGLLILRAIALVLAVVDVVLLNRIREYPVSNRKVKLKEVLFSPLGKEVSGNCIDGLHMEFCC